MNYITVSTPAVTCGSDALENQHRTYLRSTEQDVLFKQPQNSSPKRKCDAYRKRVRTSESCEIVQSLNSPFFPPHIGAAPGRAKEESRITCMRMLRTKQSKITRRAFLKRPENFSGPKTFRGSFRVNFSGPGKRFSKRPKTPRILTRVFRVVFSGLQRELDSDLLRT